MNALVTAATKDQTIARLRAELQEHAEVIARLVWLYNHGHIAVFAAESDYTGRPDSEVVECMAAWPKAQELVKRKMWREKQEKDAAIAAAGEVLEVQAVEVKGDCHPLPLSNKL